MNEQTVADPSPPTWIVAGAAVAASAFFQLLLLLLLPCAVAMAIPIMFYGAGRIRPGRASRSVCDG